MSSTTPKNSRKPWTSADDDQLRREARNETPLSLIAKRLERSEASIRNRASTLDISLTSR